MEELNESELGSSQYWDDRYKLELSNYQSHGDPGEIWFGEHVVKRILKWILKSTLINSDSKFIDIGCGNGMFLIELAKEGYKNLLGVDYCQDAINLAQSIAQKQSLNAAINYQKCDVLEGLPGSFDVIHDKGTFDAISLSEGAVEKKSIYIRNVYNSLNKSGVFIITSCNWTKVELDQYFREYFICNDVIAMPQFSFGGQTGNTVTTVIYNNKV